MVKSEFNVNKKRPVPLWVWALGAAILVFQRFSVDIFGDFETGMAITFVMFIAWALLFYRKRRGL